MKGLVFEGRVSEDGTIHLPKTMRKQLVAAYRGKAIVVTVRRKRRTRSNEQNAYYWACVIPALIHAFNELGTPMQPDNADDKEAMHCFFRDKFLKGREMVTAQGEVFNLPPTTTELSKDEFAQYLDEIMKWAAEHLNIVIPAPNEQISIF